MLVAAQPLEISSSTICTKFYTYLQKLCTVSISVHKSPTQKCYFPSECKLHARVLIECPNVHNRKYQNFGTRQKEWIVI